MASTSRATKMAIQVRTEESVKTVPVKIERIAKRHAHVVRKSLPDGVSGMLVPLESDPERPWIIVVNEDDADVRQRFTIAHELGHLLLHNFTTPHADSGYKVRFRDQASSAGSIREEIEANQFAAELLMPEDLVFSHLTQTGFDYASPDTDAATAQILEQLAEKFAVSQQALTFRIANLVQSGS